MRGRDLRSLLHARSSAQKPKTHFRPDTPRCAAFVPFCKCLRNNISYIHDGSFCFFGANTRQAGINSNSHVLPALKFSVIYKKVCF